MGCRPSASASRELIDYCIIEGIPLLYSASSIVNVAYVLERSFKAQSMENTDAVDEGLALAAKRAAFACLDNLQQIATAVGVDDSDIWLARKYEKLHSDFEDNLVLAAVERSHAGFLVTNDEKLMNHAPCAVFSPESMLEYLKLKC